MTDAPETAQRPETCDGKVRPAMESCRADIRELLAAYNGAGDDDGRVTDQDSDHEGCSIDEYALAFDYVEPGTFGDDQSEAYWRYQISTGGPGEEIRYYRSFGAMRPYRVEFWFLDWFDGAHVDVTDDVTLAQDLWDWLEGAWSAEERRAVAASADIWQWKPRHEREGY